VDTLFTRSGRSFAGRDNPIDGGAAHPCRRLHVERRRNRIATCGNWLGRGVAGDHCILGGVQTGRRGSALISNDVRITAQLAAKSHMEGSAALSVTAIRG